MRPQGRQEKGASARSLAATVENGVSVQDLEHNEDAFRFEIRVDDDSPFFAGHFPDRPVLPAAAILWIVSRASLGVLEAAPCGFDAVRFENAFEPGVICHLTLVRGVGPVAESFEIGSEGRILARGHLLYEY